MAAFIPIVIPVPQTRDCIVQAGIRYCEDQPVSKNIVLAIGLCFALWVILVIVGIRASDRTNNLLWIILGVTAPIWLGIIGMIVWGLS